MTERELSVLPYLNGWPRISVDTVMMGTAGHCIGCGRFTGTGAVVFEEGWAPPGPEPIWPFTEDDCPVCFWQEVWRRGGFAPEEAPILDRLRHRKLIGPKRKLP